MDQIDQDRPALTDLAREIEVLLRAFDKGDETDDEEFNRLLTWGELADLIVSRVVAQQAAELAR